MKLSEYLINGLKGVKFISITGGGGKSSLLKLLGSCFKEEGKSVLLTTTTKIQSPEFFDWGCDMTCADDSIISELEIQRPCCMLFANRYEQDARKWQAPDLKVLGEITKKFDVTVAEADGSRRLPLKIHTKRDPVIATYSEYTVAVMGIWALGKNINESVFGYQREGVVDFEFLNWYVNEPQGLLKGNPKLVIVNGAEMASTEQMNIVRKVKWPNNLKVIATSIANDEIVEVVK